MINQSDNNEHTSGATGWNVQVGPDGFGGTVFGSSEKEIRANIKQAFQAARARGAGSVTCADCGRRFNSRSGWMRHRKARHDGV